jgi:hypothetical protein
MVEPFVPEPSASEFEVAVGKLKRYKSPGVDQIPVELVQAGGETLHSKFHILIMLARNKEELPHQCKESIVVPIHKCGGEPLGSGAAELVSYTILWVRKHEVKMD